MESTNSDQKKTDWNEFLVVIAPSFAWFGVQVSWAVGYNNTYLTNDQ